MNGIAPGWYADPVGRAELRWYDGAGWGEQVRTGARSGYDPLDLAGAPRWPAPRWDAPPAGPPAASGGGRSAMRPGLWAVLIAFVVLLAVGTVALVVLLRNLPRLSGHDIERAVATSMSKEYGTTVVVSCPPALYTGSADGTLVCTARADGFASVARVQVIVRGAKLVRWEILETDDAEAPLA